MIYIQHMSLLYVYVILDNSNCYKLSTVVRVYDYVYVYDVCDMCFVVCTILSLILNSHRFHPRTVDVER